MITVRDLQLMLDEALITGRVKLDSEVRYITRNNLGRSKDCSLIPEWSTCAPGMNKSGAPLDRRFGDGTFHLAQESELRDTPEQLVMSFDHD